MRALLIITALLFAPSALAIPGSKEHAVTLTYRLAPVASLDVQKHGRGLLVKHYRDGVITTYYTRNTESAVVAFQHGVFTQGERGQLLAHK